MTITRRPLLQFLPAALATRLLPSSKASIPASFPIGATDWSIGAKQNITAFENAKKIGLEGIQASFSTPGSEYDLRDKKVREQYYRRSDETGVRIASLGMGILNSKPLSTHPEAIGWVGDAIDTLAKMKKERPCLAPNVCLLAFFSKGNINGEPQLMKAVANKLKTVMRRAEDAGVLLGIESLMSADDHLKVMDAVGSKSLQVYYDTANSNRMGYNIYEETVRLGANRICQIHCKENGAHLGEGIIDFPRYKTCLDKIGYKDWLIIEGATPKRADVQQAYRKNFQYLDKVFRSGGL